MSLIIPRGMVSAKEIENIEFRDSRLPAYMNGRNNDGKNKPLQILLYNIMPDAVETENHFMSMLAASGYDIEMTFVKPVSYTSKHVDPEHFEKNYCYFEEFKNREDFHFDGIMYTGAPLAFVHFNDVVYKDEWNELADWAEEHVTANLFICWSAFAYLYYRYGVWWDEYEKGEMRYEGKFSGIFPHRIKVDDPIYTDMNNPFQAPHSRERGTTNESVAALEADGKLTVMVDCETGPVMSKINGTKTFLNLCHLEYDQYRLDREMRRDGSNTGLPEHYYIDDNPDNPPVFNWHEDGLKFYRNWVKYYVASERTDL